jgi:hypothetical protein
MRLAVLSNEKLGKWINWGLLGPPLLGPLSRFPNASLIAPPPISAGYWREWLTTFKAARGIDTLFWMQGSSRPELPLSLVSIRCGRARRSAYVIDAWKGSLTKIGTLAVAQRLDPCFVAFREGCDELTKCFPKGKFEWLPFGCDHEVFRPTTGKKDVFAYWMGRRYEPLHQALLRYCSERGLEYRYTRQSGEFKDPADLGKLVGRTQYFLVTPPDLDDPVRTGGFSPFVMRYLEGLSAGARLLGVLPKSGEYQDLLPREAMLEVAPDGSDLAEKLDADRSNSAIGREVEKASVLVREHHSWAKRAEQIYSRLLTGQSIDAFRPRRSSDEHP